MPGTHRIGIKGISMNYKIGDEVYFWEEHWFFGNTLVLKKGYIISIKNEALVINVQGFIKNKIYFKYYTDCCETVHDSFRKAGLIKNDSYMY